MKAQNFQHPNVYWGITEGHGRFHLDHLELLKKDTTTKKQLKLDRMYSKFQISISFVMSYIYMSFWDGFGKGFHSNEFMTAIQETPYKHPMTIRPPKRWRTVVKWTQLMGWMKVFGCVAPFCGVLMDCVNRRSIWDEEKMRPILEDDGISLEQHVIVLEFTSQVACKFSGRLWQ